MENECNRHGDTLQSLLNMRRKLESLIYPTVNTTGIRLEYYSSSKQIKELEHHKNKLVGIEEYR